MYNWRKLTPGQREEVLTYRRRNRYPWHSLPHFSYEGEQQFFLTAACYEHQYVIGQSNERMSECEDAVLKIYREFCLDVHAWCILPNHYHSLVRTEQIEELRHALGQFHGSSSYRWNGEDNQRGRKVWHNCFERRIESKRHFWPP